MSREIKFRGLDSSGNWQYGNLIRTFHFTYIADIHGLPAVSISTDRFLEVDPGTVGQYTGLKDQNGVEIYKGDVIDIKNMPGEIPPILMKSEVVFQSGCFGIMQQDICFVSFDEIHNGTINYHVIGNIHQNPGLLKK